MSDQPQTETSEHPDVIALNLVYKVLASRFDEQTAIDICAAIGNEGVVFRMAQWWIENQTATKETVAPR